MKKAEESRGAGERGGEGFEPRIVGFLCRWCAYAGADLAGTSRIKYPPNVMPIRVMCSGRVDPVFVIKALMEGADGVLIAGCHPGDCHYRGGNYIARKRFLAMQRLLDYLGIDPKRVRLEWISASEGTRYAETVADFTSQIRKLGPISLKVVG